MENRSDSFSESAHDGFSGKIADVFTEQSNGNVKKGGGKFQRGKNSCGANNGRNAPLFSQTTSTSSTSSDRLFRVYDEDSGPDEIIDMEIEDGDFFLIPNETQQHAQEIAQHKQTIKDLQNLVKKQQEQLRLVYSEREKYKNECKRCIIVHATVYIRSHTNHDIHIHI